MRKISYCQALNEAQILEMRKDPSVFVCGIGVPDFKAIFGSCNSILKEFGPNRCFDTPVAEESMTGFVLGAALGGLRPIHIHIRVDFLLVAMNQLVNMVSLYRYKSSGRLKVPLVIRAMVGKSWGQALQHSRSLHGLFAHIPGLKVICPTRPVDAKGMLTAAIRDDNPVICIEHRWLFWQEDDVPEGELSIPLGKANILREGKDVTIVATSWMNVEAVHAAKILQKQHGLEVEIVDPRSIVPLDTETILNSVRKTKKCIIADNDWLYCGFSGEIASIIYENCFNILEQPIQRIGFAQTPCPAPRHLENVFYPNAKTIVRRVEEMLKLPKSNLEHENFFSHENKFKGPF